MRAVVLTRGEGWKRTRPHGRLTRAGCGGFACVGGAVPNFSLLSPEIATSDRARERQVRWVVMSPCRGGGADCGWKERDGAFSFFFFLLFFLVPDCRRLVVIDRWPKCDDGVKEYYIVLYCSLRP